MWVLVVQWWNDDRPGWELSVSRWSFSFDAAAVWYQGRVVYGTRTLATCTLWRTRSDAQSELVRTEGGARGPIP